MKVIAYEILKGQDFFDCPNRINGDLVLCNPPFNNTNGETQISAATVSGADREGRATEERPSCCSRRWR